MGITNHHALAASFEQPLALEAADDAADGVQRRPGHLSDVLPGERQIDEHTRLDTAARLLNQPQQRTRDSTFHLFSCELAILHLELVQSGGDEFQRIQRKAWMALHEERHRRHRAIHRRTR